MEYQWHGFFYGGDCYLVLYTYDVNGKPCYILYIWQVGQMQALSARDWILPATGLTPFSLTTTGTPRFPG